MSRKMNVIHLSRDRHQHIAEIRSKSARALDLRATRPESARDLFLIDQYLDPPIHLPTVPCAVVGDRLARAVRNHANLGRVEALLADQISGHTRGAPLSELV